MTRLGNFFQITKLGLACFLFGALSTSFVSFGGQIYLSELVALLVLGLGGLTFVLRKLKSVEPIIWAYGLILVGLFAADIVNGTAIPIALKGWATIAFTVTNTLFLFFVLSKSLNNIFLILIGTAIAKVINKNTELQFIDLSKDNYFKANLSTILEPTIIVLVCYLFPQKRLIYVSAFLVAGIAFVLLGARSQGLLFLGAGLVAASYSLLKDRAARLQFLALLLVGAYGLYIAYVNYVLSLGTVGHAYNQLAALSNPYNPFALLAYGRVDALVAWQGIMETPLLGKGSWAADKDGIFSILKADLLKVETVYFSSYITAHSVILTAWLWGGVLGLIGMVILIWNVVRRLQLCLLKSPAYRALAAYLLIYFAWHVAFSPFGHLRLTFPQLIAFAFVLAAQIKQQSPQFPLRPTNMKLV